MRVCIPALTLRTGPLGGSAQLVLKLYCILKATEGILSHPRQNSDLIGLSCDLTLRTFQNSQGYSSPATTTLPPPTPPPP